MTETETDRLSLPIYRSTRSGPSSVRRAITTPSSRVRKRAPSFALQADDDLWSVVHDGTEYSGASSIRENVCWDRALTWIRHEQRE